MFDSVTPAPETTPDISIDVEGAHCYVTGNTTQACAWLATAGYGEAPWVETMCMGHEAATIEAKAREAGHSVLVREWEV